MNMSTLQSKISKNEPGSVSKQPTVKKALKWVLTGLPLGGVVWASFLPLQPWMQQTLVLVVILWFYVFFLLDSLFMGG